MKLSLKTREMIQTRIQLSISKVRRGTEIGLMGCVMVVGRKVISLPSVSKNQSQVDTNAI